MDRFYEAVANFLEEQRCDSEQWEYTVMPEEMKEVNEELKQMNEKLVQHLERLPETERKFFVQYFEILDRAHFKEEQRSYYQGIMDGMELLCGLGLIKRNNNMKKILEKLEK